MGIGRKVRESGAPSSMWGTISPSECSALYKLVATSPTDLVIKTDRNGRIVHASPAAAQLGMAYAGDPVGRHLLELIDAGYAEIVIAEHRAALTGGYGGGWIELLAHAGDGRTQWMEVRFGGLPSSEGVIAIMRSIEDRRALENRLFAAAMTDPLTGLANRNAFARMLEHLVLNGSAGHLALLDLDHFRTINLRHGHSGGDLVLRAVAKLLRSLLRADDILCRIDGGTFGILLPDTNAADAHEACTRVLAALTAMSDGAAREQRITASAGIAPFACSADATLREAELALIAAKARGRARVERAGLPRAA